jgi:hypothetical protein
MATVKQFAQEVLGGLKSVGKMASNEAVESSKSFWTKHGAKAAKGAAIGAGGGAVIGGATNAAQGESIVGGALGGAVAGAGVGAGAGTMSSMGVNDVIKGSYRKGRNRVAGTRARDTLSKYSGNIDRVSNPLSNPLS